MALPPPTPLGGSPDLAADPAPAAGPAPAPEPAPAPTPTPAPVAAPRPASGGPGPAPAAAPRLPAQADISREIAALHAAGERDRAAGAPAPEHPARGFAPYRSSALRHPHRPLVEIDHRADPEAVELRGPAFGVMDLTDLDADLTRQHAGEPLGERITVSGRIVDRTGRPVRGQLVEIWQANASGRYAHQRDQHPAPLDPHFTGVGRCLTDDEGRYAFTTVKPGAYPWRNHQNAWRPAHIHFSLFGSAFTQRLITQMYFPGDPLFPYDPILGSVTDPAARARLVAAYDHELSLPEWSLGYRWDIVLDGPSATWIEEGR
ncbi:protocatechuate 3,4-dioxygenase subunit beta [Streptomyces decoyicus]|uniref:protocatechuate 3,4-dioxygenase subunit beta n=1 Tax=Streptomyces decoyicus TaxID=249567 RepID=UPI001FE5D79C|nr:protocatechuate 3,4-dioxygenase subunit beta [Streptomyces decoyicus]